MGFKDIPTLGNSQFIDFEILNDLAENDLYLKNIIPDVYVKTNNTAKANSEGGSQMKIQGSSVPIAPFTGRHTVFIPFIKAHNGRYTPPVTATAMSTQNMYCQITKIITKGFYVTLTPSTKKKVSGVRVNWIALTQIGD